MTYINGRNRGRWPGVCRLGSYKGCRLEHIDDQSQLPSSTTAAPTGPYPVHAHVLELQRGSKWLAAAAEPESLPPARLKLHQQSADLVPPHPPAHLATQILRPCRHRCSLTLHFNSNRFCSTVAIALQHSTCMQETRMHWSLQPSSMSRV